MTENPPPKDTPVPMPDGARRVVLDALRFLAAALIVLYHYQSEGPWPLERLNPAFLRGYLATDFFLILSGYVLGGAYGRKLAGGELGAGAFLTKRVLRVWPSHLVMLGAFAALVAGTSLLGLHIGHQGRYEWSQLAGQALLIHAWGLNIGAGWNLPTWSLSALIVCYAAFPVLWRRLGKVGSAWAMVLGGLALVWGADRFTRAVYGEALYDLSFNLGVLRALPLFAFGACLARAGELDWVPRRWAGWLAAGAGLAVIGLQALGRHDLLSMALLGVLIGAGGAVRATRGAKLAAQAGELSFALYITHIFVAAIWFHLTHAVAARFAPPAWAQWSLWALSLPVAITAAMAFDRWVDRPLRTRVGRWTDGLSRRGVATAPTA